MEERKGEEQAREKEQVVRAVREGQEERVDCRHREEGGHFAVATGDGAFGGGAGCAGDGIQARGGEGGGVRNGDGACVPQHRGWEAQVLPCADNPKSTLWIDEELLYRWSIEDGFTRIESMPTQAQHPCQYPQQPALCSAIPQINPPPQEYAEENGLESGWMDGEDLFSFTENGEPQYQEGEGGETGGGGKEEGMPAQTTMGGVPEPSGTSQQSDYLDFGEGYGYGYGYDSYDPYDDPYSLFGDDRDL